MFNMKLLFVITLATTAFALPQAPAATNPTPTSELTEAKPVPAPGVLPKEGLRALPWPAFESFASSVGLDPAKATAKPGDNSG
jgi:hypothetical protein